MSILYTSFNLSFFIQEKNDQFHEYLEENLQDYKEYIYMILIFKSKVIEGIVCKYMISI